MLKSKIRAVVIDDSAFMRKSISIMLESDEDIEVVATARDGEEGYNFVKSLVPDIVTLDIEMPKMDGLTALQKIMKDCPVPVLMVSSLTTEGAEATIKALEYGAVDFIPKELSYINVNIIKIKEDLIKKIKEIVKQTSLRERIARLKRLNQHFKKPIPPIASSIPSIGYKAVALGISTGGPLSLQKVIPSLSKNVNVPFFIVQHMPPKFTKSLAQRLDSISTLEVKEAEDEEIVKNGVVYIAPGGYHMHVNKEQNGSAKISIDMLPDNTLHRPSVDVMISSVVKAYGKYTLAVVMTGMGKDGLQGVKELKEHGGYCLTQDEESCVVYGMPRAIVEAGLSDLSIPLEKISETINKVF